MSATIHCLQMRISGNWFRFSFRVASGRLRQRIATSPAKLTHRWRDTLPLSTYNGGRRRLSKLGSGERLELGGKYNCFDLRSDPASAC
jgi:hypothetical protein